jgi:DNA-directed RNA polymerase subunit RPC12/RpoP
MPPPPPSDQNEGVKRFLADLRTGFDRRSWHDRRRRERRFGPNPISIDRRNRADRRALERREHEDRRRNDFETYSAEEVTMIEQMMIGARMPVACPRCGGNLLLALPAARGAKHPHAVQCTQCRSRMSIAAA